MKPSAGVTKIQARERWSMRRRFCASGSVASPKRAPRIAAGTTVAYDDPEEVAVTDVAAAPRADEPADAGAR